MNINAINYLTKHQLPKQSKNNPEKFVILRILHLHLQYAYKTIALKTEKIQRYDTTGIR